MIHAWDSEVSLEKLTIEAIGALKSQGKMIKAPGLEGWDVIIPWAVLESVAEEDGDAGADLNKHVITEDGAQHDPKEIRNPDGTAPRLCIARWIGNLWLEICPERTITPDGMISMFLFVIQSYPNNSPGQNARRPMLMLAGGSEMATLEDLQRDLTTVAETGDYDLMDRRGIYEVSMRPGDTFEKLARRLDEQREHLKQQGPSEGFDFWGFRRDADGKFSNRQDPFYDEGREVPGHEDTQDPDHEDMQDKDLGDGAVQGDSSDGGDDPQGDLMDTDVSGEGPDDGPNEGLDGE